MHSFPPLARSPRVWLVNEIVHFIALLLPCFLCFCSLTLKATAAVGPVASFLSHCEAFLVTPCVCPPRCCWRDCQANKTRAALCLCARAAPAAPAMMSAGLTHLLIQRLGAGRSTFPSPSTRADRPVSYLLFVLVSSLYSILLFKFYLFILIGGRLLYCGGFCHILT